MSSRICDITDCGKPAFGKGYCYTHYYRLVRKPKQPQRMAECVWCGERKPINEIRHPLASKGKAPSTCHACREAHPDLGWCDFHNEAHPRDRFQAVPPPIGILNICPAAASIKASRARGHAPILCVCCGDERESWNFRGGRQKCPTCRTCESRNPGKHWCIDCAAWLPQAMFTQTGRDGKFWTVRCKPCRTANTHGVTVKFILERQGSVVPECACCGSVDFLKVDHDHRCCPSSSGCAKCVRGYLCHECNTAEGLLRTSGRARMLADYMTRWS